MDSRETGVNSPDVEDQLGEMASEMDSVQDQISAIGAHLTERRGQIDRIRDLVSELKTSRAEFDRTERALRSLVCETEIKLKKTQADLEQARVGIAQRDGVLAQGKQAHEALQTDFRDLQKDFERERAKTKELSGWIKHYLSERSSRELQVESLRTMIRTLQQERDKARLEATENARVLETERRTRTGDEQKNNQLELRAAMLEQHLAAAKAGLAGNPDKLGKVEQELKQAREQSGRMKKNFNAWREMAEAEVRKNQQKIAEMEQLVAKTRAEADERVRRAEEQARLRIEQTEMHANERISELQEELSVTAELTVEKADSPLAMLAATPAASAVERAPVPERPVLAGPEAIVRPPSFKRDQVPMGLLGTMIENWKNQRTAVDQEADSISEWTEILKGQDALPKSPTPPPFRGATRSL